MQENETNSGRAGRTKRRNGDNRYGESLCSPQREVSLMNATLWLAFLIATVLLIYPSSTVAQNNEEGEIRAAAVRQGEMWSRHDVKSYAALFTDDCDVVNVLGWWWKGRAELESKLKAGFVYVFKESKLTITEVQVRFLDKDMAIAHARWTMTGARTPPGVPEPREGLQTLVFTKKAGQWLIAAFHNTNAVPERPFPTGPR